MNQKREGNLASSTFGTHQYGAQEAEVVAVKLSQKLGPEFISTRSGPGGCALDRNSSDGVSCSCLVSSF